jgi:prepilin-type N-terminal cleavage/methylation domain-containing protein/prepilin-type processing-associated H-X9-DG protein
MKKSAFTLIELLVVISIIAILAGIALPVFSTAMERGRAVQDLANLRQLGIGTTAYLADNNDQIFSSTAATSWPATLFGKYVPNWGVFKSPFDSRTIPTPPPITGIGVPCSYGVNPNILVQTAANPSAAAGTFTGNTTTYTTPSQLIYMAPDIDVAQTANVAFLANATADQNVQITIPGTVAQSLGTHARRSQINVLYADSHVASIPYTVFSSTPNPNYQWLPVLLNTH